MFKSYTINQAKEAIDSCSMLLSQIINKGNILFDSADKNVLDQCISTTFILINDLEPEAASICESLTKAHIKLQSQRMKNDTGFFNTLDIKIDLKESISYLEEAVKKLNL